MGYEEKQKYTTHTAYNNEGTHNVRNLLQNKRQTSSTKKQLVVQLVCIFQLVH